MRTIHTRPTTADDVLYVAERIRKADRQEIAASVGGTPLRSLTRGLSLSAPCRTIVIDDVPVAIFGVVPDQTNPERGFIWMLGTDAIESAPMTILRNCRALVETLNTFYPILTNVVDARNTVHLKWLRWCGFEFIKKHRRFGRAKRTFIEFVRHKPCAIP